MRGVDHQQSGMFSYISAERRVPKDHPLRAIRVMVDAALKESSWRFDAVYSSSGRPSIPPEKLLRALLLQMLYTVRSERLLMEQLDYNFLFRWFVGPAPASRRPRPDDGPDPPYTSTFRPRHGGGRPSVARVWYREDA
jgi:transposase-like protein DUF772